MAGNGPLRGAQKSSAAVSSEQASEGGRQARSLQRPA
uniref:Uncharacterized protein n=1 Tax=Arundo donax TaxID=35708 RepID=A0A0A9GJD5_ARUDO